MDQTSKRRGRPSPDAVNMKPIAFILEEALAVENTYRPNLVLILQDLQPWEVSIATRDGAIHVLRLLRVWFDVPQDVFFTAATYLDSFLARMKVQEKYLKCLTISCFYSAAKKFNCNIDVSQLVSVSQSNCSIKDMLRMVDIINEKLKLENTEHDRITTCADFLIIYLEILEYLSACWEIKLHATDILKREQLVTRLEILLADNSCAFFRSSILALVLIKLELEKYVTQGIATRSMYFIGELVQLLTAVRELQFTCKIKSAELIHCSNNASNILKQYDNQNRIRHSDTSVWRFSATIDKGNRYRNFQLLLDTIEEQNQKFS